jgi:hypothetical protein
MNYKAINGWFVVRYEPPQSSFKVEENLKDKQVVVEILNNSPYYRLGNKYTITFKPEDRFLVLGRDLLKIEGEENLYLVRAENILSIIRK